ncbi:unnamed protein product [Brassica oleracea]
MNAHQWRKAQESLVSLERNDVASVYSIVSSCQLYHPLLMVLMMQTPAFLIPLIGSRVITVTRS